MTGTRITVSDSIHTFTVYERPLGRFKRAIHQTSFDAWFVDREWKLAVETLLKIDGPLKRVAHVTLTDLLASAREHSGSLDSKEALGEEWYDLALDITKRNDELLGSDSRPARIKLWLDAMDQLDVINERLCLP